MKFGQIENPGAIDFTLPDDHHLTEEILSHHHTIDRSIVRIGCPTWSKKGLPNFYPRGTKDELTYYSTKFNCIELNATFYRIFSPDQVRKWREKVGSNFSFLTKIPQSISQFKRLKNVEIDVDRYLESIVEFDNKLGCSFLQMHPTFSPASFNDLESFIENWPKDVRLALELRHPAWYADEKTNERLMNLLVKNSITHIITDTPGRRDLMHMSLTSPYAFIRFTGANHKSDKERIDMWYKRLEQWIRQGIKEINFIIHQHDELELVDLASHLTRSFNYNLDYELIDPKAELF